VGGEGTAHRANPVDDRVVLKHVAARGRGWVRHNVKKNRAHKELGHRGRRRLPPPTPPAQQALHRQGLHNLYVATVEPIHLSLHRYHQINAHLPVLTNNSRHKRSYNRLNTRIMAAVYVTVRHDILFTC
jgi:hypothetical protein